MKTLNVIAFIGIMFNLVAQDYKVPIIYSNNYNMGFFGLEKLAHKFDASKFSKVFNGLCDNIKNLEKKHFYEPSNPIDDSQLALVHDEHYLKKLNDSEVVAKGIEMPVSSVPNFLLRYALLTPMRYATAGTILGVELALKHGWAVNIGGGFHHAKRDKAEGFCFFADIPLAVHVAWEKNPNLKVLVVDLDAHQGNGVSSIFKHDKRVAIYDVYNKNAYPAHDIEAKKYVDHKRGIDRKVSDNAYLAMLKADLPEIIEQHKPDVIIYNAGSDILAGDPIGGLNISEQGIVQRDEIVFDTALEHKIPILMVLSGGYTPESAQIITNSLTSIIKGHKLIDEEMLGKQQSGDLFGKKLFSK